MDICSLRKTYSCIQDVLADSSVKGIKGRGME